MKIIITLFALLICFPAAAEDRESIYDYYDRLKEERSSSYDDDEKSVSDYYSDSYDSPFDSSYDDGWDNPFDKPKRDSSPYYERKKRKEDRVKTYAPKGGQQLDTWERGTKQWSSEEVLRRQLETVR